MRRAFSIWGQNLLAFSLVAVVAHAPLTFFWLSPRLGVPLQPLLGNKGLLTLVSVLLTILVSFVAAGGVTYGVIEQLRGHRVEVGAMLAQAFKRGPAILAVALATLLAVAIGLVLLIIPGIYLNLALWLAIPVAVVERRGILESLKRSRKLTDDHLSVVFGVVFLVNAFDRLASKAIELALPSIQATSVWLAFGVSQLVTAILMGLPAVACAVAYHDLRVLKEGVDTSELAKVFE